MPPGADDRPPGTPEKLAVLEQRAKMKQALFHPPDARYAGDPRPIEAIMKGADGTGELAKAEERGGPRSPAAGLEAAPPRYFSYEPEA